MNNIALGRYIPLDSKIHKMDPRIKIVSMIVLMTSVFMLKGLWDNLFMFAFLVVTVLISKLTFGFILKALKPMLPMLIILSILNIFVLREGPVMFSVLGFGIHTAALQQTAFITTRLVMMIMVTTLLTATTSPLDLTFGIEDLLNPLRVIKVPAHEIAMMISITLRFIPTLIEDTQKIMNAQASRGVDLKEGTFKEKINGVVSMIVPLTVQSFHRAEDLADAMESKGYFPGKARTRYKQLQIRWSDWVLLSICVLNLAAVLTMGSVL